MAYKRLMVMMRSSPRAVVLIMVLAVLTILLLLAVSFSVFTRAERTVTRNYVDKVRAKFLAQSGVERSIADLKVLLSQSTNLSYGDWYYYGEDANRNGQLDAGEDVNNNGNLDVEGCPIENALSPSFAVPDQAGLPKQVTVNGQKRGYSGSFVSTYTPDGDLCSLKVVDLSSKIYINGGKPDEANYPYNAVLARILNTLGQILGVSPDIGTQIINNRPSKGYKSEDELENVLGKDAYKKIKEYITVYAWVNEKVVRPIAPADRPLRPDWAPVSENAPTYATEQLNPANLVFEPRAPVNVNMASKEVLQAVLADLKGFYLDQSTAGQVRYQGKMTNLGRIKITPPITLNQAGQIAREIITRRRNNGPFKSWQEFFQFCDTLPGLITPALTKQQVDVIKSNANPNNNLNDFNPNALIYRDVDKTDLMTYSTEFCLGSMGYFDIDSIGRILNKSGQKIAESKITTRVQLFDFWHETTQEEFEKGIISEANGVISATNKKSLQVYPESRLIPYKSDYDGYILLSTLEAPYQAGEENLLLRASFNDLTEADVATGEKYMLVERDGPFIGRLITPADKIGCLYPDGIYSEAYKCLRFPVKNNIHPSRGSIVFWYKPNWDPQVSLGKRRTLISMCRRTAGSTGQTDANTQMFFFIYMPKWNNVSYASMSFNQSYGFYYEGRANYWPFPYSNCGATPDNWATPEPHKWQLISMEWDFSSSGYANCVRIYVNGQRAPWLLHDRPGYHGDNGSPLSNTDDLSEPDNPGIRIGELIDRWAAYGNVDPWAMGDMTADATIDELCVFEMVKNDTFNLLHYKIGRYYNYGDAFFTSAPKDLGANVTLSTVSATLFIPKEQECRGAAVEFEIVDSAGNPLSARLKNGDRIVDANGRNLKVSGPVSYRIYFKEEMQDREEPILESPVVDDVTITYLLATTKYFNWVQY